MKLRSATSMSWIVALVGFFLRVAIAVRTLDVVDRMFVPDDTYYTLNIARSMARGLGPTADGVHVTNGFQPLIAFLMVPVFWIVRDPDAPLRVVWIFLSLCDLVTTVALGAIARRAAPSGKDIAQIAASTFWALSPVAVGYALGGLETSLALMTSTLLTLAWIRARESNAPRDFVFAGLAAGCALLARIDLVFLVGGLGAYEFLRGSRVGSLRAAGSAAVVISPWWLYELARLHTVIPTSGEAVRQQAAIHQALYLTRGKALAYALGTVLEAPTGRYKDFREILGEQHTTSFGRTWTAVLLIVILAVGWKLVANGKAGAPVRLLIGFGIVSWFFYALYVPALWFFPRYMSPMHVATTIELALISAAVWGDHPVRRAAALVIVAAFALIPGYSTLKYTWILPPDGTMDVGLLGAKGYRRPTRAIVAMLPKGSVLGALQTGALGYYGIAADLDVVNFDGVVDLEAANAFRDHNLAAFARKRHVTYFTDWDFNTGVFLQRSGDPSWTRERLDVLGQAPAQAIDRFTLYKLPP